MPQFRIPGRRPLPFKATSIRFAYTNFPDTITRTRTNNASERLNRETRRRTRIVGTFTDEKSALTLMAARLKYVTSSEWDSRRYLEAPLLKE